MLWNEKWNEAKVSPEGETFLQAAEYMRKHGWCQTQAVADDGRVCLVGALSKSVAADRLWSDNILHCKYQDALAELEGYLGMSAAVWNDDYCQSKEQAIAKLIDAAFHHDKM